MSFEYYLNQPRSMIEWKLREKLDESPESVCLFSYRRCSHPLIQEYFDIHRDEIF